MRAAGARISIGSHKLMQTTTAFELPGFRVMRSLGVVRGITVRTRSLPMSILGSLRTLLGGRAGIFSELCESAREESFQLMLAHARKMGANGVIGVRVTTRVPWWARPKCCVTEPPSWWKRPLEQEALRHIGCDVDRTKTSAP